MSKQSKIISFDSILLSILVIANIMLLKGYILQKSLYVGLLLLYILLDFFSNTSSKKRFFFGIPLEEYCRKQKHVVLLLVVFLILIWPTFSQIYARQEEGLNYFAHDGLIQTEEAAKLLLQGKNPYKENYLDTPMANWTSWNYQKYGINPALYHFPYLPFTPLFAIPFYLLSKAVLGWFDLRLVSILMFAVVFILLERLVRDDSRKLQLLMLFSLNPWFADFFDEGRNDIFILAWVVFSIYALKKNNILFSSIFLAFACLSKQTALFLIPFYFAYLMKNQFNLDSLKKAVKKTYPLFILAAVIMVPFLLWDYNSFIDDVFSYHSGTSEISYPAGGYGIAAILVESGFMNYSDYFPFWIPQLLFGLPLLYLLLKKQESENTLRVVVINYVLLTFIVLFFSRSFHDNYLGYLTSLMALGFYMDD